MEAEQIILAPLTTEKSVAERPASRYVFKVHLQATKIAIKMAIEKIFKVRVIDVNTCKVRAKVRSSGRSPGRTSSWKKAYVTLSAGQKIAELEA
jgi:large subunit ribosomal protein L23